MADHRAPTRSPLVPILRAFRTEAFQKLAATTVIHAVVTMGVWVLMGIALIVSDWPLLGILVLVFGAGDTVALHLAAVRWAEECERQDHIVEQQKSLLASQPGGAPMIAELKAHCGCVHRWAYDPAGCEWVPMELLEVSDKCLMEAR